ncbi:Brix-domain-containing protein [Jaminaea rosea]|uniref:Brix-domain-containing protein n=1 Tax=Jaminaea rosea TaxID=1569628 RepID=A0A316USY5_9BASI|nr:Brix-domain-containing protein [Jaminaea rosea]PWN26245.1 Brix-domain-containing protein [Jaminaea rosea]
MASLLRKAQSAALQEPEASSSSILEAKGGKRKATSDESDGSTSMRRNKQRVLLIPSRGVTSQMRHLVSDLEALMPQSKKDSKLDSKSNLHIINELAELNNCNNTLYFEARKHQDLYMWASKTPNGPSAKLFIQNIHTMDELKMTGNCLKGSRPVLSFDAAFDSSPHWSLLKEMLTQAFGVPRTSRRTKPFVDHVLSFSILDGKIWFRNWQIVENSADEKMSSSKKSKKAGADEAQPTLVEIGPRFVMTPIRIFEGSFGGATLYENPEYISPNAVRHLERRQKGQEYKTRSANQEALRAKKEKLQREKKVDELAVGKVFA